MSRYVFQIGFVALALLLPFTTQATISVQAVNFASTSNVAGTTKYFFPTAPGNTNCTPQQSLISVDPSKPAPGAIDTQTVGALVNSVLIFTIASGPSSLATIAGQAVGPSSGNLVSIRVELPNTNTPLPLVVLDRNYPYNGANGGPVDNVNEISYGVVDGATVSFGIAMRDVLGTDVGADGALVPSASRGLCTLLSVGPTLPLDAVASFAFCNPPGGTPPTPFALNFGLIPAGGNLSSPTSDTTAKNGTSISMVLSDCPVGATAAAPRAFFQPALNFALVPGDQRIKLANNTVPPSDGVVPVTGVVVEADSQYPVNLNGPIQRINTSIAGGIYTIDGLVNDTKYCFSLGYVNAAGWASTNATWSASLQIPSPAQCASPSQIDGFLNRSTCFIASAAYGEEWDPRLEILRQFRDQILDHFALGRAFTDWYYGWSPAAAHWLIENPSYRTFVRVLLMPTVEMARVSLWIRANMWVFGVMLLLGTAMAVTMRRRTT